MKILYVSQYFPPEMGAPAARASELARHWADAGHQVSILTGFPNHPTGVVPPEWRSRLRRLTYTKESASERVSHLALAAAQPQGPRAHAQLRFVLCLRRSARHDHSASRRHHRVFSATAGRTLRLVARFRARVPFVFEVRDLWPESLAAVGVGDENSFLHHALAAIARFLYRRPDRIVVVTPAFKDHLIQHWRVPAEKIAVVENGVETDLFAPAASSVNGSP